MEKSVARYIRWTVLVLFVLSSPCAGTAASDEKNRLGPGFVKELAAPESNVLQAVQEVVRDQTIHGTYVYEREKTLTGATEVPSASGFGEWKGSGHVFYKEFNNALAPRHFVDSGDIGTIAVRYVVQSVDGERIRLRIDAIFVEKAMRRVHRSDGTVESSEYKAIEEHLKEIQFHEQEVAETRKQREEEETAKQVLLRRREDEAALLASAQASVAELEERVKDLRRRTEMRVKETGGQLLSAPFHSAAVMQTLPGHTELLILMVTPYWYGVETPAGQHGWVHRQELEQLP